MYPRLRRKHAWSAVAWSDGQLRVWNFRGEPCWQTQVDSATTQCSNDDMCWQLVIANKRSEQLLTRFSRAFDIRYRFGI